VAGAHDQRRYPNRLSDQVRRLAGRFAQGADAGDYGRRGDSRWGDRGRRGKGLNQDILFPRVVRLSKVPPPCHACEIIHLELLATPRQG